VDRTRARHYRWANVAVLVVSAYALAASQWGVPEHTLRDPPGSILVERWLWLAYLLSGILGFASVFTAIWRRWLGRVLAGLGGVVALSGFLALREFTLLALISLGVVAATLLAAAIFMGPMPTPEQEGLRR